MSRTLIKTEDVPAYVRDLIRRARPVPGEPYVLKIWSRHKCGYESGFSRELERLVKWCRRYYATADVLTQQMWWDHYRTVSSAYSAGWHNYATVEISDPVMWRFEKDGFYMGR